MQTFLPVPDFTESAKILDYRRLGKQRIEAQQIYNTLIKGGGWEHHPAVKMWRGFENCLLAYFNAMVEEWIRRGFKNTRKIMPLPDLYPKPPWLGLDEFHASHRSNLLRKNPVYYEKFGWVEPPDLPYYWPEAS